jgi:RNA ligase
MYGGLFTQAELEREENAGYVRIKEHPEDNELWIANYTEKAAYEGYWNNVTLNCRGLIFNAFGDILAMPFPKFFNYGQAGCPEIDLDAPATVSDKMDGSLGILYKFDGNLRIATRGSFSSDQAIHATEILNTKYASFKPVSGWTYLFEIVYPQNRIVCDYGDLDDLVFLGAVHIPTRISYDSDVANLLGWKGPVTEVFPYSTMREALMAESRSGKEGFVVHLLDSDVRVKIKQEDYILLHRIVTGLNARSVWEAMVDGAVDKLIDKVPDEFHEFIRKVESHLSCLVMLETNYINEIYWSIVPSWVEPRTMNKKDFALKAIKHKNISWALFQLWDNKNIQQEVLKRAKPSHDFLPEK